MVWYHTKYVVINALFRILTVRKPEERTAGKSVSGSDLLWNHRLRSKSKNNGELFWVPQLDRFSGWPLCFEGVCQKPAFFRLCSVSNRGFSDPKHRTAHRLYFQENLRILGSQKPYLLSRSEVCLLAILWPYRILIYRLFAPKYKSMEMILKTGAKL